MPKKPPKAPQSDNLKSLLSALKTNEEAEKRLKQKLSAIKAGGFDKDVFAQLASIQRARAGLCGEIRQLAKGDARALESYPIDQILVCVPSIHSTRTLKPFGQNGLVASVRSARSGMSAIRVTPDAEGARSTARR